MVKYLREYVGNRYRIFVVSRSKETTSILLSQNIEVGEIIDNKIVFLPENMEILLSQEKADEFNVFCERDILDISESGIIYRWYSRSEGDAGIATTSRCNSNCIMCPAGDNERHRRHDLNMNHLKTIVKYMPKDLWYFTITGGEPTLIGENNFLDAYRFVKQQLPNTKILLLTNGRTFGDKSFFQKFSKEDTNLLRIAVPIHGSTALKHDYITRAQGSFEQTLRGITNILNAKIELEIRIVVSKLNKNDIFNIAKLIVDKFPNTKVVHFVGLEMRGNCVVNEEQVIISYEEAFNYSKEAIKQLMSNGIDVALYNFPYCMIDEKYWSIAKKSISTYKANYYEECQTCSMKEMCCGIFTATKNFYKPTVLPINR